MAGIGSNTDFPYMCLKDETRTLASRMRSKPRSGPETSLPTSARAPGSSDSTVG
jgi:hypothetical protein